MISFFINLIRLLNALWHGIKADAEFRILLYVLLTLLAGSTFFYSQIEGWNVIDSLYFSVMTMSTIGYGDLTPTTALSKMFTILFALLSIGIFVAVVSKIVSIILEQKKHRFTQIGEHLRPTNNVSRENEPGRDSTNKDSTSRDK